MSWDKLCLDEQLIVGTKHSELSAYKKKVQESLETLNAFMNEYSKQPYLALSWGKQSIVLAHMIYNNYYHGHQIPMYFMSSWESDLLHDFVDVEEQFRSRWDINYHRILMDNVSDNNLNWVQTRHRGRNDLQTYIEGVYPQWDGVIMGLSKEESMGRRVTLSIRNTDHNNIFRYVQGKYRCCPLANWKEIDLAAYIATHDLPLLDAYKQQGLHARTTARITQNNAQMNGMLELKRRNLTNYRKIIQRFPELSTYS